MLHAETILYAVYLHPSNGGCVDESLQRTIKKLLLTLNHFKLMRRYICHITQSLILFLIGITQAHSSNKILLAGQ